MYIQYRVDVRGIIRDQLLKIKPSNNDIENIVLQFETTKTNFDILFISFYFTNPAQSVEEAKLKTKTLLNDLINLLIYKFNATFKEPILHSHDIGEKSLVARGFITLFNPQQHVLTDNDCNWLSSKMNDQSLTNKLQSNVYFKQYRSILTIDDDVSRYLLLYGLLYEIKGTQKLVDTFIENEEKNEGKYVFKCQTTKVDRKTNQLLDEFETKYTWWRNQAQHMQDTPQSSTDIEELVQHLSKLENPLKILVYKAIINLI